MIATTGIMHIVNAITVSAIHVLARDRPRLYESDSLALGSGSGSCAEPVPGQGAELQLRIVIYIPPGKQIFTRFNTNQDTSKAHSTSSQLPLAPRRPSPETRATEFGSEARKGLRSQFRPGLVPDAQVRLVHAEGSS